LTDPVKDPLALLQNISVVQGARVWTSGTWDASYIGEYVRFGKELGVYKITTVNTFTPRYYGPALDRVNGHVRPAGTKKIAGVDDNGDRSGASVGLYYWAYPSPLYDEEQDILLPSSRPLELGTAIRMLTEKDRRDNAADRMRMEYVTALAEAKSMNPRQSSIAKPTNAKGYHPFDMRHA
jgi:hypothetical protein